MIHDAFVEVTCDGKDCSGSERVELEFVYPDYSGKNGYYDHEESKVEATLIADFEWIVTDGKHYCCAQCASPTGYA